MALSAQFLEHFSELEDPRIETGNFRHNFNDILSISLLATICGADNWVEICEFAHCKQSWLNEFLELPSGIPSHDTFSRIFTFLDAHKFEKCFINWVSSDLVKDIKNKEIIAIDGKTSRRSHNRKRGQKPLHMVSAWAVEQRISLGQLSTEEKSNEIEAIPRLIGMINIKNSIITIDAMGCQKAIAEEITEQGGDYILTLKENHPTLAKSVENAFRIGKETVYKNMHYQRKIEKVKGHGRQETRRYTLISCKDTWGLNAQWKGLKSLGKIEVTRTVNHESTYSTRYFLTSLEFGKIDDFMRGVRGHWHVEINLHWSLDVSFADDLNRSRNGNSAENLSIIKRVSLNMLKQENTVKVGITAKRKRAGWDCDYLKKVLNNDG